MGVLGQKTDGFSSTFKKKVENKLMEKHDCQAVWVPDADFTQYYDVFCHRVRARIFLQIVV